MGWKLPKCPIQVADWLVLPDIQVCRWPTCRRVMNKQSTHHSGLVWGWSGVIYGTYDQDKHKKHPTISGCGLDLGVVAPMQCSLRVCFLVKVGMVSLVPAPPWVPAVLMCLPVTQYQLSPPWDHTVEEFWQRWQWTRPPLVVTWLRDMRDTFIKAIWSHSRL